MTDDPWEQARERTREEVRAAFAERPPEQLTRTCAFCGVESTTHWEHCPACGRSYFDKPPRLGPRAKRAVQAVAALALIGLAVWLIPEVLDLRHDNNESTRSRSAALVAAEKARLRREQTPHHGAKPALKPAADASRAEQIAARRSLVDAVETSITADARARVAKGQLTGRKPERTECGPLVRNQEVGDEDLLSKPIGRYSCVATTSDVTQDGKTVGLFGIPFVAALDFEKFTYTWCKDNPAGGVTSTGLAFVRLARECLAAKGKAFGTGYLSEDDG